MIELNKKWDGNKIRVVNDEKGRPNNRAVQRKLAGMEGALARSKVPLSEFETWYDLPEPLRDDLWEAMQKEEFGSSVEHDDRSVKWLRARQKKNDEFVNDATMEIAERIGVKCSLTLKSNIVAKGLVFKNTRPQEKINDIPLGEANFQVQIDTVIKPNPPLPVPVGDLRFVKDEEKLDLLRSEKARKDNKGKQIKDFGVVAKMCKILQYYGVDNNYDNKDCKLIVGPIESNDGLRSSKEEFWDSGALPATTPAPLPASSTPSGGDVDETDDFDVFYLIFMDKVPRSILPEHYLWRALASVRAGQQEILVSTREVLASNEVIQGSLHQLLEANGVRPNKVLIKNASQSKKF
ncbi:hypothetical protein IFM89_024813 [Coptis chinensis]|uniref:Uncharacterized protein n=1 Tax=Coptis chinensis TaxID=261450 RepID=A0A835IB27_9MAGN|nr:hypothetical protein IFM89_024813 [Coptis chinensis]